MSRITLYVVTRFVIATGAAAVLALGIVALAAPLAFTTQPFVTNITTNSAVVNWVTDASADSTVWYTANPPGWAQQNPNVSGMVIYDIGGVPGGFEQWAVGFNGKITHTTNGIGWSEQNSGTTQRLYGVDALPSGQAWAVGNGGTILYYNGSTWSLQSSGVTTALNSVKAFASNNVWAVGNNGLILRYNGTTWVVVTSPTTEILSSIDGATANDIWVVGYNGTILKYNGTSWQLSSSPTIQRLHGVVTPDNTNAWAAGDNGILARYNGTSWSLVNSNTTVSLYDIDAFDANHVWAVGFAGTVTSTADGISWMATSITGDEFDGVNVVDSTNAWAGGLNSSLFHYGINFTNSIYNSAPSSSTTLAPLSSNTTYYYMVEASDGVDTIVSALGSFRTLAPDTQPPPAPSLSGTTECTTGGAFFNNLSWNAVTDPPPDPSGVSGYTLLSGGTPLISNQPVTNHSHSGLTAGTSYNYVVRAHDNAGNTSLDSNVVSLTTKTKDLTLTNTTGAQSVRAGDQASYSLNLTSLCGFNESATLTVTGLPAATTPSFAPNSFIPAAGGTLVVFNVATQRTATAGTYPLTITATSATLTKTVSATLTITPPSDFTLSVTPSSRTVVAGQGTNYTATLTPLNGFSDTINVSVSGLPSGVSASFAPSANPTVSGSATALQMNISTTAAAAAGTHTLTVSATDAGGVVGTKTQTVDLIVNPAPDFTLTAVPTSHTTPAGDPVTYVLTLTSQNGLSGTATISATTPTAPTNTSYTPDLLTTGASLFLPANGTANLNFQISPSQTASTGTFVYTVSATVQGITKTIDLTLVIGQPKDFTITVSPTQITISQGSSGTITVTIATANGLDGNVNLSVAALPSGSTGSWSANPVNPSGSSVDSDLTINAGSAAPGTYTVTLTGTFGALSHSTTFDLTVVDTAGPIITFISVVPDVTFADIAWRTNEGATSGIYYWETANPSSVTYVEDSLVILKTDHAMRLTGLTEQTNYTFQIVGYDLAGNRGEDIERTFTTLAAPDTIPPTVAITSPTQQNPAVVLSGTVAIQGTAADNIGVTTIDLKVRDSGGAVTIIIPRPTYDPQAETFSTNWDTLSVSNGPYDLFAEASDAAGNTTTSNTVPIQVNNDTAAPQVTNVQVEAASTTAIITWQTLGDPSTSEIDYGLENANGTYSYTDRVAVDDTGDQYVEQHKVTLTGLTPFKRYHYQITSCDSSGNCGH